MDSLNGNKHNVASCAVKDLRPDHLGGRIVGAAPLRAALNPVQNLTGKKGDGAFLGLRSGHKACSLGPAFSSL